MAADDICCQAYLQLSAEEPQPCPTTFTLPRYYQSAEESWAFQEGFAAFHWISRIGCYTALVGWFGLVVPPHIINWSQTQHSKVLRRLKLVFMVLQVINLRSISPFVKRSKLDSITKVCLSPPRNFCPGQQGRRPDEMRGHKLHRCYPASVNV